MHVAITEISGLIDCQVGSNLTRCSRLTAAVAHAEETWYVTARILLISAGRVYRMFPLYKVA
jgi:hypothetical protein